MIFIHYIYKYIPTYRVTLPNQPTRETKHQIGVALAAWLHYASEWTPLAFREKQRPCSRHNLCGLDFQSCSPHYCVTLQTWLYHHYSSAKDVVLFFFCFFFWWLPLAGRYNKPWILQRLLHRPLLTASFNDYITYIDINECAEDTDDCAQTCTDTDGSYTCLCDVGYELANDEHGCDGE